MAFVTRLALDYRMTFHKDVVIDLVCYRRLGHNESDEPAATQPVMYSKIRAHKTPRQIYAERLVAEKVIAMSDADAMVDQYRREMDEGKSQAKQSLGLIGNKHTVDWTKYHNVDLTEVVKTGVRVEQLRELATKLTTLPVESHVASAGREDRHRSAKKMAAGRLPLDWGFAENLRVRDAAHRRL